MQCKYSANTALVPLDPHATVRPVMVTALVMMMVMLMMTMMMTMMMTIMMMMMIMVMVMVMVMVMMVVVIFVSHQKEDTCVCLYELCDGHAGADDGDRQHSRQQTADSRQQTIDNS
jgi:membrane protein YdbS with pleckstrin-like domain